MHGWSVVLGITGARQRRLLSATALLALLAAAAPAGATVSPGGRFYEQVSPVEKFGSAAGAGGPESPSYGIATPDGNGIFYSVGGPMGDVKRGLLPYAVGQRSATGWSAESRFPLPSGSVNFSDYQAQAALPSEDLSRIVYGTGGGGIVPGNPTVPHGFTDPAPFALYRTDADADGGVQWLTAPTIANPDPAVGHILGGGFVPAGASSDLSTVYFGYYGTLVPEDASRAPNVTDQTSPWGFYRWANGHLEAAGVLPDGSLDPYGAVPAGAASEVSGGGNVVAPIMFRNQVSRDGSRAFFVSPDPRAGSGRMSQLYVRKDGTSTVLVSRSAVTGFAAPHGALRRMAMGIEGSSRTYAYASRDGSRVFFESFDPLTADAPAESLSVKAYIFDIDHETLEYLPGVAGDVIAASDDLSRLLFGTPNSDATPESATDPERYGTPRGPGRLSVWADGHATQIAVRPRPTTDPFQNYLTQGRASADGSVFAFQSNAPIPGFNNSDGFQEVYRYELASGKLECLSCPPPGQTANRDSVLSHDGGSASAISAEGQTRDGRGMTRDGGRVFFDTTNALVPRDSNGQRDVYMWEDGKVQLISTGVGSGESNLIDISASGDDVFFATTEGLSDEDRDGEFDVYDARVGGGFATSAVRPECASSCRTPSGGAPPAPAPATGLLAGQGDPPPAARPTVGKVKVSKVGTVRGTSAVLKVQAPAAGTIIASGARLVAASKRTTTADATSVTVRLSRAAQKTLARKRKLVVKVAVRFRPATGAASVASVTVTFVAKATARRATVLSSESRKGR
ncbi:MAG TPA: hypothetical protein VFY45_05740 [Baekduia sp.]|nr:hypothetical protein [Baekduia sp.]